MNRPRVLFQGNLEESGRRGADSTIDATGAEVLAQAFGRELILRGLDLVLIDPTRLDAMVGSAAVAACKSEGQDPRSRVRTYLHDYEDGAPTFGMVLPAMGGRRWVEGRTAMLREVNALVALAGGRHTADALQKAQLAQVPVFPIPTAGGAAREEYQRLRAEGADVEFLGQLDLTPQEIVLELVAAIARRTKPNRPASKRVFIVHGHDTGLKNEAARLLTRLGLDPVILHEQVDTGRTLFDKLRAELSDVGFAFVLLTPDDVGGPRSAGVESQRPRARQNVIFEHGWLIGALGPERVCGVRKGEVEEPTDLRGIVYKNLGAEQSLSAIALDIARELRAAGYNIDLNALVE